jgi:pimeloyl-ACP methyl ester carboxylesterase
VIDSPAPRFVVAADGLRLATFEHGAPDADPVVALHGFASTANANWGSTGWVRDLTRAGHRIILVDQRGHGASGAPHDPSAYSIDGFVADLLAVIDAYGLDTVTVLGYSLGSRVGWRAATTLPHRIRRGIFGGLPAGDPLSRFDLAAARDLIRVGRPIDEPLTATFMRMASTLPGNDLEALVALIEGLRGGPQAETSDVPQQPLLVATGADDPIVEQSRTLAAAAPDATFLEIPGRHHFNAPTSGAFRRAAVEFLAAR